MKTNELEKPKHAKLTPGPKHEELPEIADYERVPLEKFDKPEFEKTGRSRKVRVTFSYV